MALDYGNCGIFLIIGLWVMQDLYHQPYDGLAQNGQRIGYKPYVSFFRLMQKIILHDP